MSNGLTLDRQGRVLAAEHDGRCVTRVADDGTRTVLAERFEGKRLNSPNDIVVKSDGSIYFTDPPYAIQPSTPGMPRPAGLVERSPSRAKNSPVTACTASPRTAPCACWWTISPCRTAWPFPPTSRSYTSTIRPTSTSGRLTCAPDGTLTNSRILLDMASDDPGVPDGFKVDQQGNVFCTGPGGVWVCRPNGKRLGRIVLPELPANLAWGEDGSVLFLRRVRASTGYKPRRAACCWSDARRLAFSWDSPSGDSRQSVQDAATAAADEKALRSDAGDAYTIV